MSAGGGEDVSSCRQEASPVLKLAPMAQCSGPSSASVRLVLRGRVGPIAASAVVVRLRHLATVFGFSP
jgi:hypothetical protein